MKAKGWQQNTVLLLGPRPKGTRQKQTNKTKTTTKVVESANGLPCTHAAGQGMWDAAPIRGAGTDHTMEQRLNPEKPMERGTTLVWDWDTS